MVIDRIKSTFYSSKKRQKPYYSLVASLPELVLPLPVYKTVPLADDVLPSRLSMMEDADRAEVEIAVDFLCLQSLDADDEPVKTKFVEAMEILTHEGLQELLQENMRWRTVLSALVRSVNGKSLPDVLEDDTEHGREHWGFDEALMEHIRTNWNHPNFSLSLEYPNIIPLRKMLNDGHFARLGEWVEHALWTHFVDMDEKYEFTVENVVLFLVRREMIKRRLERSTEKTVTMIEQAVTTMIDKTELAL